METLIDQSVVCDAVMKSPLCTDKTGNQEKLINTKPTKRQDASSITNLICWDRMSGSINSSVTLDDSTPSDSGVQTMDSDVSEVMVDSITSQTGLECEDSNKFKKELIDGNSQSTLQLSAHRELDVYDDNSNITTIRVATSTAAATSTIIDNTMTASQCSIFDTTENIVYRRKVRKTTEEVKTLKKRVSFHEDILKSTRTDNIHIEHGFITYKTGFRKFLQNPGTVAGRYSWCSEGDQVKVVPSTDLTDANYNEDYAISECGSDGNNKSRRYVVYRNACSDVLDYGNSDIYDVNQGLQNDNSGIFEYMPKQNKNLKQHNGDNTVINKNGSSECSCSNSSSDSDENDKNANSQQYSQAKSNSCDCIRSTHDNNNIGDNCYYSEPIIRSRENSKHPKSVWNKEKKPKSSCLKKNITNHTNFIIPEQNLSTKMKKFNVHDINNLLDNSSKMIFGSLRSIFTIPLPERGVPEGSEDMQSVAECVPEMGGYNTRHLDVATGQPQIELVIGPSKSPPIKAKPFLSKSLDGSKQQNIAKKFVHNVDEQLRRRNETELYATTKNAGPFDVDLSLLSESKNDTEGLGNEKIIKQLRRKNEFDNDSNSTSITDVTVSSSVANCNGPQFRSKFIINCESTVFEHTGVSYTYDNTPFFNDLTKMEDTRGCMANIAETITPIVQLEANQLHNNFINTPLAKTFSNFFRSIKEVGKSTSAHKSSQQIEQDTQHKTKQWQDATDNYFDLKMSKVVETLPKQLVMPQSSSPMELSSTISEMSSITNTTTTTSNSNGTDVDKFTNIPSSNSKPGADHKSYTSLTSGIGSSALSLSSQKDSLALVLDSKPSCHLPSPLRKPSNTNGNDAIVIKQYYAPQRYSGVITKSQPNYISSSQDTFSIYRENRRDSNDSNGRDSKSTLLSVEFDDILTITTDTDKNDNSDIVILDYPVSQTTTAVDYSQQIKSLPNHPYYITPPAAKTSLINRFLRNVTQKKILESSIKRNQFFAQKLTTEKKLFNGELYVKGVKGPRNLELIDDLNAEIAMEIETCAHKLPQYKLKIATAPTLTVMPTVLDVTVPEELARVELGIGEISTDVFLGVTLNFLLDQHEQLMKAFKLYTGYSREGFMIPVLVFLTNKTLYVTDLVRNRLCSKFILLYKDLDVILMGPYGNIVLLSNSTRDMQQVLLTGGSNLATCLVANLELCARRNGSVLPAIGQLTIDHLAPLKKFVHENACINKNDNWLYYAVVNMPGFSIGTAGEQEPLGPRAKGFLMHRHIKDYTTSTKPQPWNPGYFLLKAGVLYMFNDSTQKIPSWAVALAECQGTRRTIKAQRPHCFEIMLKDRKLLQLAAPDEYVASEWLQALLQTASGLFEMQEKHKILGCTVIVTENHLITMREDFSAPLKQINKKNKYEITAPTITARTTVGKKALLRHSITFAKPNNNNNLQSKLDNYLPQFIPTDSSSLMSSAFSTPTCGTLHSRSSINSTPKKLSQLSHSTTTNNTSTTKSTTPTTMSTTTTNNCHNMLESSLNSNATNHSITSTSTHSKLTQSEDEDKEPSNSVNSQSPITKSIYGKNSGVEILTSANIKDLLGIKIPPPNETWWCILEFSYQEVREFSDDLVIFFANRNEMQHFLKILEQMWKAKHNDLFPITIFDDDDLMAEQCTSLYMDINRSWEPLLSAALGYPL